MNVRLLLGKTLSVIGRSCRACKEAPGACRVLVEKSPGQGRVLWPLGQGQSDERVPPSEPHLQLLELAPPRAPKVSLGSLRRVDRGCLEQGTGVSQVPPSMDY